MIYRWRQRDMWKSLSSQKYQHHHQIGDVFKHWEALHYPDDTSHLFWLIWKVQKLEVWTAQKTSALVTLALAPFTNSNALKSPQNKFSFLSSWCGMRTCIWNFAHFSLLGELPRDCMRTIEEGGGHRICFYTDPPHRTGCANFQESKKKEKIVSSFCIFQNTNVFDISYIWRSCWSCNRHCWIFVCDTFYLYSFICLHYPS